MRRLIVCLILLLAGPAVWAADPLPYAAYAAFVRQLHQHWYVPRSAEFAEQSRRLAAVLQGDCADTAALRTQWLQTVGSWERFSAVRGGALLARRSPREIDFMPTRPEAIAKAIRRAPADAAAMDQIGSPAKGLPALEWLLWAGATPLDAASCRYAQQAAAAVAAEAQLLQRAYELALARGWDDGEAEYAMYEFLNLWDAGLQKLWWEELDRPLQKAAPNRPALFSRALSGHSLTGWRGQWLGLRQLALGVEAGGPSISAYLRANGQPEAADKLQQQVLEVDRAMAALELPANVAQAAQARATVSALKALQQFAEGEMATALHFVISFFDEDGD
nr:imelysin family protein [uncultured Roseateles sp.]